MLASLGSLSVTCKSLAINIKRYIEPERDKAAKAKAGRAQGLRIAILSVLARIHGLFHGQPLAHAA